MQPSRDVGRLIEIMAALRDKDSGCPWDLEQSLATIAPYTIEEAYEVADAIQRDDMPELKDELGDLLLQVAYHARLAEEIGAFAFGDVVEAVTAKMIRRHPHVFGDEAARAAGLPPGTWERGKEAERRAKAAAAGTGPAGVLAGVPVALPALTRAAKLQKRAATVGFDWRAASEVMAKIREEAGEIEDELAAPQPAPDRLEDEVGDLLFAVVNLARHLAVDPESALRRANAKFERRFKAIEAGLAANGRSPAEANLDEMEAFWQAAKAAE